MSGDLVHGPPRSAGPAGSSGVLVPDDLVRMGGDGRPNGGGGAGPRPGAGRAPRQRVSRRPRQTTPTDAATFAACLFSSACLFWLVFARLTDGAGWMAFVACTYLGFLALFAVATNDRLGWLVTKDRLATIIVATAAVLLFIPLVWLVGYLVKAGLAALRPSFVLHDQEGVAAVEPATAGGGLHAVVGTSSMSVATMFNTPITFADGSGETTTTTAPETTTTTVPATTTTTTVPETTTTTVPETTTTTVGSTTTTVPETTTTTVPQTTTTTVGSTTTTVPETTTTTVPETTSTTVGSTTTTTVPETTTTTVPRTTSTTGGSTTSTTVPETTSTTAGPTTTGPTTTATTAPTTSTTRATTTTTRVTTTTRGGQNPITRFIRLLLWLLFRIGSPVGPH
jgi:hypothetical protein